MDASPEPNTIMLLCAAVAVVGDANISLLAHCRDL